VVCNYKAYFAIRPHAKLVYACELPARGVLSRQPDLPTNDVSLLCLIPEDLSSVTNLIGGRWKKLPPDNSSAAALARTRYAVDFYRRETE